MAVSFKRFLLLPAISQPVVLLSSGACLGTGSFDLWAGLKVLIPFTYELPQERKQRELLLPATLLRNSVASP